MKDKQGPASMECQEAELADLLPFYLNGDVSSDQAAEIESHLPTCSSCQKEILFWVALSEQGVPAWRHSGQGTEVSPDKRPVARVSRVSVPVR